MCKNAWKKILTRLNVRQKWLVKGLKEEIKRKKWDFAVSSGPDTFVLKNSPLIASFDVIVSLKAEQEYDLQSDPRNIFFLYLTCISNKLMVKWLPASKHFHLKGGGTLKPLQ